MRASAATFLVTLTVAIHIQLYAQSIDAIQLDGEFDDWNKPELVISDPKGDAAGAFDLSRVSASVDGTTIYLRFDTQESLNLQNGSPDDGTLRLLVDLGANRQLEIDFRGRQALLITGNSTSTIPWRDIQFASLPTYAARDFELRLDLGPLGVRAGEKVAINFDGSDRLSKPMMLTIGENSEKRDEPPDLRKPSESIRVASLNTLKNGSASPRRAPSIKNLFEFADADIYCFNEAIDEQTF